jgi:hypothetical protein
MKHDTYNLRSITINFESLTKLKLTLNEYLVASAISKFCTNPSSVCPGWFYMDSTLITPFANGLQMSRATAYRAIKKLKSLGLIEFNPEAKNFCRGTTKWYEETVGINSPSETTRLKMRQNVSSFDKEKESTKEREYINISSPTEKTQQSVKPPACPLNWEKNKTQLTPLQSKYPKAHEECIEYYLSVEDRRGYKFINKPKQFGFIHKILRAGYGFDDMNRAIKIIEKKYEKGAWDFASMASWLEKGASNGNN